MQLRARSALAAALLATVASSLLAGDAQAESGAAATGTLYHERGGPLHMTVVTPSVDARAGLGDVVDIRAGWEADIVSGASVAVVDAPAGDVDAISTATKLTDKRHTFGGGLRLNGEHTSLDLGYSYGFESDYRSHAFRIAARADMFERNTTFELSYARGFDSVCNVAQPDAQQAVNRRRMPSSEGCFGGGDQRTSADLDLQTFQGSWTQAWTPILSTQLTLTTQLLHGYQANPYRAVWLGRSAAQEHHPRDRARYSAGLGGRLWLEPLRGALQLFARVYRDSWDIDSVTGELAYVQNIAAGLRLRARGRYYTQSGAVFYSDDYVRFPRGRYFTGDRELAPMTSWTAGARAQWTIPPADDGTVLGILDSLELVAKGDFIKYRFPDFRYGQASVPNDKAVIATLGLEAFF